MSPATKNAGSWLLELPLVAFGCAALITLGSAPDAGSAHQALAWLWGWIALALLTARVARRRGVWRAIAMLSIFAGTSVALYFVAQFSYLGVDPKIPLLSAIGRALSSGVPRVGQWFPFSNSVATWLEGLIPLGAGLAMVPQAPAKRWVLAGATVLMAFALALTMSRGSWFGLIAASGAWTAVALAGRRARPFVAGAIMLALLALGVLMTWNAGLDAVTRLAAFAGPSLLRLDRLDLYRKSLSLLDDVGLLGLGPGAQFTMAFSKFTLLIPVPFVTYPHQFTLHVWLAYGVPGMVAWIGWMSACAAVVASSERQQVSPAFRGAWCGIVAVLVHGLTDARQAVDPWTWGPLFVLYGLVIARHRRTGRALPNAYAAMPLACVVCILAAGLWRAGAIGAAWETGRGIVDESLGSFGDGSPAQKAARLADAVRHYERAIELEPSRASARRRLALIAADRNDFGQALKHALVALEADPAGYTTRKTAGLVAAWCGDFRLARSLLEPTSETVDELRAWSYTWKDRGQSEASSNALQLSAEFVRRPPP
jgi:O-antigen ligase